MFSIFFTIFWIKKYLLTISCTFENNRIQLDMYIIMTQNMNFNSRLLCKIPIHFDLIL